MILVTGGNGRLGRQTVQALANRRGGTAGLAVSVRDPDRAADLAAQGITVRRADFDDADLTAQAFDGVDTLFLISTHDTNAVRLKQHGHAVAAAQRAGVGHIVYTSFPRPEPENPFSFAVVHRTTEAAIRDTGLPFTFLRNGSYADSLARSIPGVRETGRLEWPTDEGAVAYTAVSDLAAAAAAVLADAAPHAGATYTLTGPAAIGADGLADHLADRIGRPVELAVVPEDLYAQKLRDAGAPDYAVESAVTAFRSIALGYLADVTDDIERLSGRPPISLKAALARMAV